MAKLRVNILQTTESDGIVPVASESIICDPIVGVQMSGPIEALLHRVEEIAALGPSSECISMDLVLDLRGATSQLAPGFANEIGDCIRVLASEPALLARA